MKRICCAALIIVIAFIASCKKDGATGSAGQWSFAGTKYNAGSATFSKPDSSLTAVSTGGRLSVFFPSRAVTSDSYRIVHYDSVPLQAGQVYIRFIDNATSQYYFSTGEGNVNAQVTVSQAGKISLNIPDVNLMSYANPVPYTASLTAAVSQQ